MGTVGLPWEHSQCLGGRASEASSPECEFSPCHIMSDLRAVHCISEARFLHMPNEGDNLDLNSF